MDKLKIAIIGAGGIAHAHSDCYEKMEDVKIIAVADIRTDEAAKIAEKHKARVYASMDELLENEKPDMVDICTPSFLHAEMAIKAAEMKIHVLCEKPIALNSSSARLMVESAERNGVLLMIAQVIRFCPEYEYLKRIYHEKLYGELRHIWFSRISQIPDWGWEKWFIKPEMSGMALMDLHVHDVDFVLHMLGKPNAVQSFGMEQRRNNYISTQYIYGDKIVEVEGGWFEAPLPFSMSFRAIFDKAVLHLVDGKLIRYEDSKQPIPMFLNNEDTQNTAVNTGIFNPYYKEIRYFIECIREGIKPERCRPEEAVSCIEVIEKEIESLRTGKRICIK